MNKNIKNLLENIFNDDIFKPNDINQDIQDIGDHPNTWDVGDILCGTYNYSMIIPYFYKIIKRTNKSFTVVRLSEKVVSGHYNGQYTVIPDKSKTENDIKNNRWMHVRINKWNRVHVQDVYVTLWDGKPLHGDDMD